jgi:hypothetical protein
LGPYDSSLMRTLRCSFNLSSFSNLTKLNHATIIGLPSKYQCPSARKI